ncbi:unnamed protein product [Ambrosiozyma monospora]|uniref:Unnamed protein product n=1 Tax=Ambrosiozyma monospora TaxID=43982 RepID=A0ACB5SR38_AMBMO|nr:unnamed protein product [Ambrosiozyma monospora]
MISRLPFMNRQDIMKYVILAFLAPLGTRDKKFGETLPIITSKISQFVSLIGLDPQLDDILAMAIEESSFNAVICHSDDKFDQLSDFILRRSIKMRELVVEWEIPKANRSSVSDLMRYGCLNITVCSKVMNNFEKIFGLRYVTDLDLTCAGSVKRLPDPTVFEQLYELRKLKFDPAWSLETVVYLQAVLRAIRFGCVKESLKIKLAVSFNDDILHCMSVLNHIFCENRDYHFEIDVVERDGWNSDVAGQFWSFVTENSHLIKSIHLLFSYANHDVPEKFKWFNDVSHMRNLSIEFGPRKIAETFMFSNSYLQKLTLNNMTQEDEVSLKALRSLKKLVLNHCYLTPRCIHSLPESIEELHFKHSNFNTPDSFSIKFPIHLNYLELTMATDVTCVPHKLSNCSDLKELTRIKLNISVLHSDSCDKKATSEPSEFSKAIYSFMKSLPCSQLASIDVSMVEKKEERITSKSTSPIFPGFCSASRYGNLDMFDKVDHFSFSRKWHSDEFKLIDVSHMPKAKFMKLNFLSAPIKGSFTKRLQNLDINLMNHHQSFTKFWKLLIAPAVNLLELKVTCEDGQQVDFRSLKIPPNLVAINLSFVGAGGTNIIVDKYLPSHLLTLGFFALGYLNLKYCNTITIDEDDAVIVELIMSKKLTFYPEPAFECICNHNTQQLNELEALQGLSEDHTYGSKKRSDRKKKKSKSDHKSCIVM